MAGTTITEVLKGMKCYAESYVGKKKILKFKNIRHVILLRLI